MNRKWLLMALALLLGFNIYLLFLKKKNEEKFAILLANEKVENSYLVNKIKDKDNYLYTIYSNIRVNKNKILKKLEISGLFGSKKVVFLFGKETCGSCINETLYDLRELAMEIGYDKIIVATNAMKAFGDVFESTGKGFKYLNIDTFYLEVEKLDEPIVFVIDETLDIDLLYIPKLYPELRQSYFTEIIPRYFENL